MSLSPFAAAGHVEVADVTQGGSVVAFVLNLGSDRYNYIITFNNLKHVGMKYC